MGFTLCAATAWLAYLALPGFGSARLGAQPIADWDLTASGPWRSDPARGWASYIGDPLSADAAAGISVSIVPQPGLVQLAVMWQRAGESKWSGRQYRIEQARSWLYFGLARVPEWRGQISALRVATVGGEPLTVRRVTVEAAGPVAELSRAWRGFLVPELIEEHSPNFLMGAQVRGVGWALPVTLTLLAFVLVTLGHAAARRRAADWRTLAGVALAGWILLDLRFSGDLLANARIDMTRFGSLGTADVVGATHDPTYAALVQAVATQVPAHAALLFVTDDPGFMIRSQFVFFPHPVANWYHDWHGPAAEYLVAFRTQRVQFDAPRGLLTLSDGTAVPTRLVAQAGDGAFVVALPRSG